MRYRARTGAVAGVWFAVIVVLAACSDSPEGATSPTQSSTATQPSTTSASTVAPAPTTVTTAPIGSTPTSQAATGVFAVPVIVCATTYGITPPPKSTPQPGRLNVALPGDLQSGLSVYTDEGGRMKLLAPSGWECAASFGANGSGGVAAYPQGTAIPASWADGWKLSPTSAETAITAFQTSACALCAESQACALFSIAATDYQADFRASCPATRPGSESVSTIGDGVVAFQDPAGSAGAGLPSGGQNPANGVMTYHSPNPNGSWLETCTLPASQKATCTAILNNFVASYGAM